MILLVSPTEVLYLVLIIYVRQHLPVHHQRLDLGEARSILRNTCLELYLFRFDMLITVVNVVQSVKR
jgi:hypothetical protein